MSLLLDAVVTILVVSLLLHSVSDIQFSSLLAVFKKAAFIPCGV